MPKCLDCPNTFKFSYTGMSYNESEYDKNGELTDTYKEYSPIENQTCMVCGSQNIEGNL